MAQKICRRIKKKKKMISQKNDNYPLNNLRIHQNQDGKGIYFKYSSRRENIAYYKCWSNKCSGRAKALIILNNNEEVVDIKDFELTQNCSIDYENHSWRREKKAFDDFDVL